MVDRKQVGSKLRRTKAHAARASLRGVTLVEVLIVLAIMTVISSSAAYLVFPQYKKARIKTAYLGTIVIKGAAEQYLELERQGESDACPTVDDLIDAKLIDGRKVDDPWGKPFRIRCAGDEINVISDGNDRINDTEDDIWDCFADEDLQKLSAL